MGKVFVGHDWAETHHDVYIEDSDGRRLASARLAEGVAGVTRFHELVGSFVDDPGEVTVATETDRGLFVGALVAAGYRVLAVNPMSTSRYRERHSTSGAKSDRGDAFVLAELARTDGHNDRRVAGDSELSEAVRCWPGPTSQSMIRSRQRQVNQLRSTLRESTRPSRCSGHASAGVCSASTLSRIGVGEGRRCPVADDASPEIVCEGRQPFEQVRSDGLVHRTGVRRACAAGGGHPGRQSSTGARGRC
jgi:hypothetical protein